MGVSPMSPTGVPPVVPAPPGAIDFGRRTASLLEGRKPPVAMIYTRSPEGAIERPATGEALCRPFGAHCFWGWIPGVREYAHPRPKSAGPSGLRAGPKRPCDAWARCPCHGDSRVDAPVLRRLLERRVDDRFRDFVGRHLLCSGFPACGFSGVPVSSLALVDSGAGGLAPPIFLLKSGSI